ncbi:MAG: SAM-dependent methyltransferase [Burkholderiaceae bacterium]|nr:SAM-dependent methyltransferase [Burkholderiaceae bacterium]
MSAGTLFLLPTPLGPDEDPARTLSARAIEVAVGLDYLIAENPRSARAVLGRLALRRPIQQIEIRTLNLRTPGAEVAGLLDPILQGRDAGLMSEAGCPGVADPGAELVLLAHSRGVRVVPLVGPSAILLALMGSGLTGQRFAFVGYVPVPEAERRARLGELERRSLAGDETQLLIETPYRSQALFEAMVATLADDTMLTVAAELTLAGERLQTRTVEQWRAARATLARAPTVFALLARARRRSR